jgi:hypothetical protein
MWIALCLNFSLMNGIGILVWSTPYSVRSIRSTIYTTLNIHNAVKCPSQSNLGHLDACNSICRITPFDFPCRVGIKIGVSHRDTISCAISMQSPASCSTLHVTYDSRLKVKYAYVCKSTQFDTQVYYSIQCQSPFTSGISPGNEPAISHVYTSEYQSLGNIEFFRLRYITYFCILYHSNVYIPNSH